MKALGSVKYQETGGGTHLITLAGPVTLAADYGMTLPTGLPASTSFLTLSSAGAIATTTTITLPTTGGTPSILNYYEEGSFTANFNVTAGAGASANTSKTCKFTRIGNVVTLLFPDCNDMTCGTTASNFATAAATLATRLTPAANKNFLCVMSTNGTVSTSPGKFVIDTAGTLLYFRALDGGSNFTSTQTNNGFQSIAFTYTIA